MEESPRLALVDGAAKRLEPAHDGLMRSAVSGSGEIGSEGGLRSLRLVLTALLGLAITLTAFLVVREWEIAQTRAEFQRDAREQVRVLRHGLAENLKMLHVVGTFVAASGAVTESSFRALVRPIISAHPAIKAVAWAPRSAPPAGPALPERPGGAGRSNGDAPGSLGPPPGSSFPVRHVAPPGLGVQLIGRDLAKNPDFWAALGQAVETGGSIAVGPARPVAGAVNASELMIVEPVTRSGAEPRGAVGRGASLMGFTVGVVAIEALIEGALASSTEGNDLDVYVYDEIREGERRLLHFGPSRPQAERDPGTQGRRPLAERQARAGVHLAQTLDVAGRDWTVLVRPATARRAHATSWRKWETLAAGLAITASLVAYLWTFTSRTEERRQAADLSQRLGRIVDSSFNEIYIFDANSYRFLQVSQGALHNLGYSEQEIRGLAPWEIKPEFDAASFAAMLEPLLRGDEDRVVFETVQKRKNGTLYPVEVRLQLSRSETPPVFVAIVLDISQRKTAEEAMAVAMQEAELANRAKSEFLANMSHELRTPLNAIIGFAEILNNETFGPVGSPRYREYVKDIGESGQHLLALINDVLDLSKIEAGQLRLREEVVNVTELIHTARGFMSERARQGGVTLDVELAEAPLPALLADRRMVMQVLTNLLSNAVKFTPAGGRVLAKAWHSPQSGFVVQVSDTGIGMALNDIPKALARFGQVESGLHRAHEGTGLGLPLAKSLIELHGGSLDLQSEIGVGTTVTLRFPAERTARPSAPAALAI